MISLALGQPDHWALRQLLQLANEWIGEVKFLFLGSHVVSCTCSFPGAFYISQYAMPGFLSVFLGWLLLRQSWVSPFLLSLAAATAISNYIYIYTINMSMSRGVLFDYLLGSMQVSFCTKMMPCLQSREAINCALNIGKFDHSS